MSKRIPQPFMKRLLEACHAVPALDKLGSNEDYNYVKAAQIFQAFRVELKKASILLLSDEKEVISRTVMTEGGLPLQEVTLRTEFIVRDCESTETLKLTGFGIAMDHGDKAIYKAKTGAMKYFLRGIGVIPWLDVDDAESDQMVDDLTDPEVYQGRRKKRGSASAKVLGDKQIRAFASACNQGGKTAKQQALYLAEEGVSSVAELSPERFNVAIKWAFKNGELADVLAMSRNAEEKKNAERIMVPDPEHTSQAGD